MAQSPEFQLSDSHTGKVKDKHDAAHGGDGGNGLNLLSLTEQSKTALTPGDHKEVFNQNGNRREFDIHIPKNYDGHSELPVVYMMHGLTENKDMMREYSHMNQLSDQKGFAVAYLQALPQKFPGLPFFHENSWNFDHGTLTPKDPSYNDLDYFKTVKSDVEHQIPTDPHRQYIAGFSEGGEAAQFITHEMPGTFAAIASVHGTRLDSDPAPLTGDKTALLAILGNNDDVLPLYGGHGYFSQGDFIKGWTLATVHKVSESQPLAQAPAWAKAAGDNVVTQTHTPAEDDTIYTGGSAPVEQVVRLKHKEADGVTRGGEHAWDGGNGGWSESRPDLITWFSKGVRKPDPEFDASGTVVNFFLDHPKP